MAADSVWRVQVVTSAPASLAAFAASLNQEGRASVLFTNAEDAIPGQEDKCPDLVVLDERLGGQATRDLLVKYMMRDAMTNFGVISSRPEEDFHEFFEGFGVLMQLPPEPSRAQAAALLEALAQVRPQA